MAYTSRPTSVLQSGSTSAAGFRQTGNYSAVPSQQSSALSARIATKKAELDNLKQLRDMSDTLAMQMQALENKLRTLQDGTEAVALVLANWDNVLRAISMASTKASIIQDPAGPGTEDMSSPVMPATLVRIPAEKNSHTGGLH